MKRLLLLQLRPEDDVSNDEYLSIIDAGINPRLIHRIRMEQEDMPDIALVDYAAVIVCGGPSNVSDPYEIRPDHQKRFEPKLMDLLDKIVLSDHPFLGICYGMGLLTAHQGGTVAKTYAEPIGAVDITVTDDASTDSILIDIPPSFKAFVGHKEAADILPPNAVLLATSRECPVQMYRIGNNIYGTQFHPELNADSLALRIMAYRNMGYFHPDEADSLIETARLHDVPYAKAILKRFIARYMAVAKQNN